MRAGGRLRRVGGQGDGLLATACHTWPTCVTWALRPFSASLYGCKETVLS